ncbi:hypothetical protein AB0M11_08225 [Streptomyces sp. NPDC051987]|uniref:hypothetical protein n=1 Tax=Streptomyces sp. NPDC051987 TaxID=3155808 RepID=UPI003413B4BB
MTRLACPNCPNTRGKGQYLCQTCWGRLTPLARRLLSVRDAKAFARLRELHGQIAAHKPLDRIEISR